MWLIGGGLAAFLIGAAGCLLGAKLALRRESATRYRAVLEQSPNGMLIADAETLRVIDANPALRQGLDYTLEELRDMTLTQLFAQERDDAEELLAKLREPDPRVPLQLRQRCKNRTLLEVEATGHRLTIDGRAMLAFTVCDVSLRRKVEAQLLREAAAPQSPGTSRSADRTA